jgi:outer membrane protein OmpA-like peptidoglycan-associated protein
VKKILLILYVLSSCSTPKYGNSESEFYLKLGNLYSAYSDFKYDDNDTILGNKFKSKADDIRNGGRVLPEEPPSNRSDLEYRTFSVEEIQYYRNKMMFILQNKLTRAQNPDDASKMQFYFDCWLNEEIFYTRFGLITNCRRNFLTILQVLEFQVSLANEEVLEEILQKRDREITRPPAQKKKFIVYFDFDSAKINEMAGRKIWEIIKYVNTLPTYKLRISGHTDREGRVEYNKKLSEERIKSVVHYLVRNKIPEENIIEVRSEVESDPSVITDDETKEFLNRRVEVIIE